MPLMIRAACGKTLYCSLIPFVIQLVSSRPLLILYQNSIWMWHLCLHLSNPFLFFSSRKSEDHTVKTHIVSVDPTTLKCVQSTPGYGSRTICLCKQTQQRSQRFSSCGYQSDCRAGALEFVLPGCAFSLLGKVCAFGLKVETTRFVVDVCDLVTYTRWHSSDVARLVRAFSTCLQSDGGKVW